MKRLLYTKLWGDHVSEALSAGFLVLLYGIFAILGYVVAVQGSRPTTAGIALAAAAAAATIGYLVTTYGYVHRREWSTRLALAVSIVAFVSLLVIGGYALAFWLPGFTVVYYLVSFLKERSE